MRVWCVERKGTTFPYLACGIAATSDKVGIFHIKYIYQIIDKVRLFVRPSLGIPILDRAFISNPCPLSFVPTVMLCMSPAEGLDE